MRRIINIVHIVGIVRTSQVIDYEETKQLEFTVVAYDSGVPQLSATAKVIVTVINVNDQTPKFEQESYNASVKENSPPGTHVTVVKATDGDEGPFGEVSYNLIGDHAADFNIGKFNVSLINIDQSDVLFYKYPFV
ncbi:hypothetical protein K0M31_010285 [Melipona bicolor]|uniref:Cadherin domain-containing protein n=1 Tax=Melipona bicolor TaxID=60889 RepID=A0AA40FLP0_9HYME|nr:hypothetical protein K0M31_010285 [Melipona bicolor]